MKSKLTIFLMFLSLILIVSCGKDYNALFQERVAELTKEGKYILNQYNDSVGKEHYIVYVDVDKIVVDTLGDSLQVYPLGNVETYFYAPYLDFDSGKFIVKRIPSQGADWTIKTDIVNKQISIFDGYIYEQAKTLKLSDLKCHDKDYVLIPANKQTIVLFLNKKLETFTSEPSMVQEMKQGFHLVYEGQCRDYLLGMPGSLPEELVFAQCSYEAQMDTHGKISGTADCVNVAGSEIPVSAFGTSELDNYYQEIIAKLNPTYYWQCQYCYRVLKSDSKPDAGKCYPNFFVGSRWVRLCKVGTAYIYQCQKCGIQLQTDEAPQMGACREGANHVWNQLQ